ncbi:transmembrane protein 81 [Tiliqua scincoides]|uniref:transmembrane protein 81 n=1 Tax=Tiliqua scincoides TaxID=71010 RepID=UPI00346270B1
MTTTETSLVLRMLAFASFVPLSMVHDEPVTIPKALRNATARVSISSTSCSVTCGLGYKVEETCEVGPDGKRKDCTKRRLDCLTNWICGMRHFTVLVGKPFELSCLTSREIGPETQSFSYSWRLARGIITTDDALFMPFKAPSFIIKLSPAEEYDAGTYRCDVQLIKSYKLVKRIYFGLRVIPGRLVDLNFDQSLTEGQKLENENQNQQNVTNVQEERQSWRKRVVIVFTLGIGSGVLGGILLYTLFYCLLKKGSDHDHADK